MENVSVKIETLGLIWNEMKLMPRIIQKKSYLSDLSSIWDGFKIIEKLFQRSTTSLLMIRLNFIDFEGELMIEGKNFVLKKNLKLIISD